MPPLLHVHNRVVRALAATSGGHSTLAAAHATTSGTLAPIADAVRTLALSAPPSAPSALATTLTSMMQPPVPPGVVLDVALASEPPRLVLSAYLLKADGGVADARHVAVEPDALGERLEALSGSLHACRALLAKLEAVG